MTQTISRDQFKRLAESVLKDAPCLLKARDKTNKAMDKESVLLKELYLRLVKKLEVKAKPFTHTGGFKTFGFVYEEAIYEALSKHSTKPFDGPLIMSRFLERAKKVNK